MEAMKSMFFGTTQPSVRAVKWLGMGHADGKDSQDRANHMYVHPEAATAVLAPLGDQQINLISIFGAARQGKSFLMNLLAGQQDLFKISNLREPCTQGVDLSGHFIPLTEFSSLNGCPPVAASQKTAPLQIGFVDAEGQGDRDITYDSRLVSPVLLSSKVVIFNWKDSLQADRMLNLLAVLARAAQGIELADGDNTKVFGHLHIVFRDWSFVNSKPEEVYNDLFSKERGRGEEANLRNLARANLVDAFESINVWLFPAPVANTANLKDKIRFDQLQPSFQENLRELRKTLSRQLLQPMRFSGKPLTARLLSQVMPVLVETLNSDKVIMPESIYSSMVRAQASATKDEYSRRISEYCEAAGIEELVSADELASMLQRDIEYLIAEAVEAMQGTSPSIRDEMHHALRQFANKEIKLAVLRNNEKIAERVSLEVDTIFTNLRNECSLIEREAIPMRPDLLKRRCTDVLELELNRLEVIPVSSQGKKGVEVELNRVRQHAQILFDKLEVTNERAIQKASSAINERVRAGKGRMTKDIHETLDKIFSVREPVTVASLQAGLEELFRNLIRELNEYVAEHPFLSTDFVDDVEDHKSHLAEELNRRYYLEIRQILSEIGFTAKDDLGKEIGMRLEGKLPLPEDEIKSEIDEAVQQVKVVVAKLLQGWTILKTDISAKSVELEKLGDVYAYEYLRRNQELQEDVSARLEHQQYDDLKAEVVDELRRELKEVEYPALDSKIDAIFVKTVKEMIAEFMSVEKANTNWSASALFEKLKADCQPEVENQKALNRLASEKQQALKLVEKERKIREQENLASRYKEDQISHLKTTMEKSLGERELESQRLQNQLREEAERARQLREEMEAMRRMVAEADTEKKRNEARRKEIALKDELARQEESRELKKQLEALRLQASAMEREKYQLQLQARDEARKQEESRNLAMQLNEMNRRAAELESQKHELELRAHDESMRRMEAESAARAAANAAALSARAAMEAAADERDVDMQDVSQTPESNRRAPRPAGKAAFLASSAERKRRKVQPNAKPTPDKADKRSVLEDARRAAQAEMEKRIQERTKALKGTAKKKK